jgi:kynurenine formamidase
MDPSVAALPQGDNQQGGVVRTKWLAISIAASVASSTSAQTIDLTTTRIVDLTHPFNASTLYWPTSPSAFALERLFFGLTPGGFFYAANAFSAPEHGGTHIDAPIHFAQSGVTVDRIPLEQLVARAVVIDVVAKAERDADYRLTPNDVREFESRHGRIPAGAIVLLRTGWSRRWPNRKAYLGDDTPADASRLHFPSFGVEAARLLIQERRVGALGVDVASIDYGPSTDFAVHQLAATANVPGLENLTNLHELPALGAIVVALPIKIEGGSGGPARVIALVPR